jgi:two-component system chemotaxis response regulator CheB
MAQRMIVVGASAGGIDVLTQLVANLPSDLPASIFIVVHISPNSGSVLPSILDRAGNMPAINPKHGEIIRSSHIYVAPPDRHRANKMNHSQRAQNYNEQALVARQRALLIRQAILNGIDNNDERAEDSA